MDFAWVVDALRRGLKVTRTAWAGDPPIYLYMVTEKKPDGKYIIKMHTGTSQDFEWTPTAEQMLIVDDWEEYVELKKEPAPTDTPMLQFIRETTGSSGELFGGQASEDQSDYAKEVRKAIKVGEDTGYMAEQLEMLADIYAEKISQRVAQLLQKIDVSLNKGDTNHV